MNIKEAKQEIQNAVSSYLMKDRFGEYKVPRVRQRPVLLIGDPGIGKTAIMEQIAQELEIGLVSYSMTHHTRQSAIGLPFIEHKTYGGKDYTVTEYTMSEIIASVYDKMEETGLMEGILFLDEINCVSETLAPAMLQFLQFKSFGQHQVPEGWIIVTAGNPPEHNKSVKEFDIVTLDRVKKMVVEPDYEVWKEYAYKKGIHAAIITYLDIKKNDFYRIETTIDGEAFVTARAWEDLSEMIGLYEEQGYDIDETLIGQYIQHSKIAKEFSIYYDLYNKYKSDYQIQDILQGNESEEIRTRAQKAKFDERLTLIGLLLEAISDRVKDDIITEDYVTELHKMLKMIKSLCEGPAGEKSMTGILSVVIKRLSDALKEKLNSGTLKIESEIVMRQVIYYFEGFRIKYSQEGDMKGAEGFEEIKADFAEVVSEMKVHIEETKRCLNNMFVFVEKIFGSGQEMLVVVTELTVNYHTAKFISRYGCDMYFRFNKELLVYERQQELLNEIMLLNDMDEIDFDIV